MGVVTTQGKGLQGGPVLTRAWGPSVRVTEAEGQQGGGAHRASHADQPAGLRVEPVWKGLRAAGGGPWLWAPGLSLETIPARAPGQE